MIEKNSILIDRRKHTHLQWVFLLLTLSISLTSCLKTVDFPFAPKAGPAQTAIHPAGGFVINPSNRISIGTDFPLAELRYTLNGEAPTRQSGTVFSEPFSIQVSSSPITVLARGIESDGEEGPIATNVYTLISPVGYWALDEGAGTSAFDQSGNNYTGTLGSAAAITWTSGVRGNACRFSRSAGLAYQITAGLAAQCNLTGPLTLSVWVNPVALTNTSLLIAKYSWNVDGFVFFLTTAGQPYFYTFNGNAVSKVGNKSVLVNEWSHVVVTYDYPNICFYINGNSAGSFTTTGTIAPPVTRNLQINTTYNPNFFDGSMDTVRIYSVALSQEQVKELYAMDQ